jgi:predicted nucleic-acid-binding protein
MISQLLMLIIGLIGGYMAHAVGIRISFKQRTIDNKIKVYDAIIAHWVRMRNFIYHNLLSKDPKSYLEFDKIYGESQTFIGEAALISENVELVEDINALNERIYRTDWLNLNEDEINREMEDIKRVALEIIKRMRKDIKDSTVLNLGDFLPIISHLRK